MTDKPMLSTTTLANIRSRVQYEEAQKACERAEIAVEHMQCREHQARRKLEQRERLAQTAKILPSQCRAGRALLNWTQEQLAKAAGVAPSTILEFEAGRSEPKTQNAAAIRVALEEGGVEFTWTRPPVVHDKTRKPPGDGVRWASTDHKETEYAARDEKPSRLARKAQNELEEELYEEETSELLGQMLTSIHEPPERPPPPHPVPPPEPDPLSSEFISAARRKKRRR